MFYFSEGLDDGDLVGIQQFGIEEEDTIKEVYDRATKYSLATLREHYPKLLSGTADRTKQSEQGASYCAQRRPEDGRIDWSWSARRIYNFIRAQTHPYPGAFTTLHNGQQLTIWRATLPNWRGEYYGTPGQVASTNPDGVTVICGDYRTINIEASAAIYNTRLK